MATVEIKPRFVDDAKARTFEVKNLGWLLRHAGEVRYITVTGQPGKCFLVAYLNEHIFRTEFADRTVCQQWLKARRSMRGVTVHFFDERFTI